MKYLRYGARGTDWCTIMLSPPTYCLESWNLPSLQDDFRFTCPFFHSPLLCWTVLEKQFYSHNLPNVVGWFFWYIIYSGTGMWYSRCHYRSDPLLYSYIFVAFSRLPTSWGVPSVQHCYEYFSYSGPKITSLRYENFPEREESTWESDLVAINRLFCGFVAARYMMEEWQPYLSSLSRRAHRRQLGWKHRTHTLDYVGIRQWVGRNNFFDRM